MLSFITYIRNFISLIRLSDIVDMLIIILLVYQLVKLIRETRAFQLLKGLIIILLLIPLSAWLRLTTVNFLLRNTMQLGAFAIIVIFQPELRSMLEHVGRSKIGKLFEFSPTAVSETGGSIVNEITVACVNMSKTKTGALIVLERTTQLGDWADNGIRIDSEVSSALLENIFVHNTPLHDGAVIIRSERIYSAACVLPLTTNRNLSRELGTRHRAALGMSENSDAVVVVVSEETGHISIAINGTLTRNLDENSLRRAIGKVYSNEEKSPADKIKFWKGLSK